ncbi:similar to stage IV sporulation protein [Terribacillus halophilus]|uniref:Similar to stage IV sporulation protein n=1 Tax=Terribacillus halophilus TaxID=361279 RepID=A0A1G6ST29_9BACI|nr:sporulation protein YqfD [Terribacillus halophilus]SDD19285.1 similar to stage IV sporulation protein [Terribacillus halophilus]
MKKHTQDIYFTGYVTVLIKGDRPELFLNQLVQEKILVWDIFKKDSQTCEAKIRKQDISRLRMQRRGTGYKIQFRSKHGFPFLFSALLHKKPLILGMAFSILLIFFLSNTVWKIEIKGVSPELEHQIETKLDAYGVRLGAFKLTLGAPVDIQQRLLQDIPELLWIGVQENGTTYSLEGVPKTIVEEGEQPGPRHLVAKKKGVIVDMFVSEGVPQVNVHDYVEPGDILVSGMIGNEPPPVSEEEDKTKPEDTRKPVAATGSIIARTWYNVSAAVPLEETYTVLSGKQESKYAIQFGDSFRLPIWGFGDSEFKDSQKQTSVRHLRFLRWELPIGITKTSEYERTTKQVKRTKDEAAAQAEKVAKQDLQLQVGAEADIISQKILHETVENGKVKLILYFQVNEDIATSQPISQGD